MKYKKEVFPQSFRGEALSNETDKYSSRCQVADYDTDLQLKLKTENPDWPDREQAVLQGNEHMPSKCIDFLWYNMI